LGQPNWDALKDAFVDACGGRTLCVTLERVYRDTVPDDGNECGYLYMEPGSGETVQPYTVVKVVGEGPCDYRTDLPPDSPSPGEPTPPTTPATEPPVTPPFTSPMTTPAGDGGITAAPAT
jgi:hypothetical protein